MQELQRGDPLENAETHLFENNYIKHKNCKGGTLWKKAYLFKNNKYKNCKGEILWKIQKPIFLKILNPRVAKEGPFGQTFLFENIKYKNSRKIKKYVF